VRGLSSRFKGIMAGIKVSLYKIVRRGFKVSDIVYNLRGSRLLIDIKNNESININL
jgi:hypothetical protein